MLNCNVQVRLDARVLAAVAAEAHSHGNFLALKSASALVRFIVEDYCRLQPMAAMPATVEEAIATLTAFGILVRSEPTALRARRDNAAVAALRAESSGKSAIDTSDTAALKAAFEQALASPLLANTFAHLRDRVYSADTAPPSGTNPGKGDSE